MPCRRHAQNDDDEVINTMDDQTRLKDIPVPLSLKEVRAVGTEIFALPIEYLKMPEVNPTPVAQREEVTLTRTPCPNPNLNPYPNLNPNPNPNPNPNRLGGLGHGPQRLPLPDRNEQRAEGTPARAATCPRCLRPS